MFLSWLAVIVSIAIAAATTIISDFVCDSQI
jgi:hypothetical protein